MDFSGLIAVCGSLVFTIISVLDDDEVNMRDHRSDPDASISAYLDHNRDAFDCEKGKSDEFNVLFPF